MQKINEKEKSELIERLSETTLSQNDLINMDSDLNEFIHSITE